jgi:hypothetical protein
MHEDSTWLSRYVCSCFIYLSFEACLFFDQLLNSLFSLSFLRSRNWYQTLLRMCSSLATNRKKHQTTYIHTREPLMQFNIHRDPSRTTMNVDLANELGLRVEHFDTLCDEIYGALVWQWCLVCNTVVIAWSIGIQQKPSQNAFNDNTSSFTPSYIYSIINSTTDCRRCTRNDARTTRTTTDNDWSIPQRTSKLSHNITNDYTDKYK